MRHIRHLTDDEFAAATHLRLRAYPRGADFSATSIERISGILKKRGFREGTEFLGLFEDDLLMGQMALYDFEMNFNGIMVPAGGVGGIAVEFLHKKERVAYDLLQHFLDHYRQKGVAWAALYPFRADFYRKMGFGYGAKTNLYEISLASLPKGNKGNVRYLNADDRQLLLDCYHRYWERTHGLFKRPGWFVDYGLENRQNQHVGFFNAHGELDAYCIFTFEEDNPDNFLANNAQLVECIYHTPQALQQMLAFWRTQADQLRWLKWQTQDPYLAFLFDSPQDKSDNELPIIARQTNRQGIGIMYRVIDIPLALRQLKSHRFGNVTGRFALNIDDSFLSANSGQTYISVENGQLTVHEQPLPTVDATLSMRIDDFSSMLIGAVPLRALVGYGRATVSSVAHVATLDALFRQPDVPICLTWF